ncbi:hypothetical protein IT570_08630 [Candidatus Sumerlaeota bacterium]|nr:hypothetical protein [Candidatus Sumerlaeota bacterium]
MSCKVAPSLLLLSSLLSLPVAPALAQETHDWIWAAPKVASPLPLVRLTPGEAKNICLRHSAGTSVSGFSNATISPPDIATVTVDGEYLSLTAKSAGMATVTVDAAGGKKVSAAIIVEAMPLAEFSYSPPAGKEPKQVFVAGSFNGWNPAKDALKKEADGVYRIKIPSQPGKQQYKFVVDGEWMTDPANANVNESDHGNSVIDVKGEMTGKFEWAYVPAGAPGAGAQGGFHAITTGASEVLPDTVSIILNNELLEKDSIKRDGASQTFSINVPAAKWLGENYVTVLGRTNDGRLGGANFPVTFENAQRSPRDEVIYFAFTDRFFDGNALINKPSDDPRIVPLTNYHGGDWPGITKKIEEGYFDTLGVTTLWISPVNKNTQKVEQESVGAGRYFTSYHGYWPISFTETNEQYGSMEDLQNLVKTAHQHKIAVLIDFVSNHVHEDHPLFKANKKIATPLFLPDGERNIRKYDAHPITTWFDSFLPDINYDGNPEAIPTVVNSAEYWIRQTNADGFRHDAVKHVPLQFWRALTNHVDEQFLGKEGRFIYQVGETISGYSTVAEYVGPDLLTGQFDFPTYFKLEGALARGNGQMSDLAQAIRSAQSSYAPASIMSTLLGNHDVVRFMAFADGDIKDGLSDKDIQEIAFSANTPKVDHPLSYKKLQLAFAYLSALPSPPTLYYGDEVGMTGAGDPDNRRPMQWDGWDENQKATHDLVAKLNHARAASVALRRGTIQILHESDERLVIARIAPEQVVLIALNRRPKDTMLALTLPSYWGDAPNLVELVQSGIQGTLKSRSLTLEGADYSFGIWSIGR